MKYLALLFVFSLSVSTVASAAPIIIGTDEGLVSPGRDNQGWWGDTFINTNSNNDNYITGDNGGNTYRSYFTFDLSGLGSINITGLILELRRYNQIGEVNLGFWDVTTSATDLAQRGVLDIDIFNDLGSGISYGNALVPDGSSEDVLSFVLNSNAVAGANSAIGGYFSIGASLLNPGFGQQIFSGSGQEPGNDGSGFTQQLVITTSPLQPAPQPVPVPAPVALLALGLVALGMTRRRRSV